MTASSACTHASETQSIETNESGNPDREQNCSQRLSTTYHVQREEDGDADGEFAVGDLDHLHLGPHKDLVDAPAAQSKQRGSQSKRIPFRPRSPCLGEQGQEGEIEAEVGHPEGRTARPVARRAVCRGHRTPNPKSVSRSPRAKLRLREIGPDGEELRRCEHHRNAANRRRLHVECAHKQTAHRLRSLSKGEVASRTRNFGEAECTMERLRK